MTNTKGYRRCTRSKFSRDFNTNGTLPLSTYLRTYRFGDLVDIKGNGAVQKGMPFRQYHGKTGRVFNVTKHAVGVVVTKRVRTRIMDKKLCLRIEHVKPSRCREMHEKRVKENDTKRRAAVAAVKKDKKARVTLKLKREPVQPRSSHFVKCSGRPPVEISPLAFERII